MNTYRFLLDDLGQSRTQQAVLSEFASKLNTIDQCEILWTSKISNLKAWNSIPSEPARRLGLRLLALEPQQNQHTIFFPGHIVPSDNMLIPNEIETTLALEHFSSLSNLDLFIVNNDSQELLSLQDYQLDHPDYDALSDFNALTTEKLPEWLNAEKIQSCLKLTDRPWYSVFSIARNQWVNLVKDLIINNKLTMEMIQQDVADGLVRPSLLADVECVLGNQPLPSPVFHTIDSVFVYPESRLSNIQYEMLHSKALQQRIKTYSRKKKKCKNIPFKMRIATLIQNRGKNLRRKHFVKFLALLTKRSKYWAKQGRRIIKKIPYFAYKTYAATLRPIFKRINFRKN